MPILQDLFRVAAELARGSSPKKTASKLGGYTKGESHRRSALGTGSLRFAKVVAAAGAAADQRQFSPDEACCLPATNPEIRQQRCGKYSCNDRAKSPVFDMAPHEKTSPKYYDDGQSQKSLFSCSKRAAPNPFALFRRQVRQHQLHFV